MLRGEAKWGQQSGLTLLLPHGYEGQGPEHSSGRIERFLDLCAEDNMRVIVPSTSGQFFHLLRRQALVRPRKPLIVFTPKSLLRTKESFSPTSAMSEGRFEPVLEDGVASENASRLVLCSGKVYHDLARFRAENQANDVAIVRLAQLYPLESGRLNDLAGRNPRSDVGVVSGGTGEHGCLPLPARPPRSRVCSPVALLRPWAPAASPATGSAKTHALQQESLVRRAILEKPCNDLGPASTYLYGRQSGEIRRRRHPRDLENSEENAVPSESYFTPRLPPLGTAPGDPISLRISSAIPKVLGTEPGGTFRP